MWSLPFFQTNDLQPHFVQPQRPQQPQILRLLDGDDGESDGEGQSTSCCRKRLQRLRRDGSEQNHWLPLISFFSKMLDVARHILITRRMVTFVSRIYKVQMFHLILDQFIQPTLDGIIQPVPFRDFTSFTVSLSQLIFMYKYLF